MTDRDAFETQFVAIVVMALGVGLALAWWLS